MILLLLHNYDENLQIQNTAHINDTEWYAVQKSMICFFVSNSKSCNYDDKNDLLNQNLTITVLQWWQFANSKWPVFQKL